MLPLLGVDREITSYKTGRKIWTNKRLCKETIQHGGRIIKDVLYTREELKILGLNDQINQINIGQINPIIQQDKTLQKFFTNEFIKIIEDSKTKYIKISFTDKLGMEFRMIGNIWENKMISIDKKEDKNITIDEINNMISNNYELKFEGNIKLIKKDIDKEDEGEDDKIIEEKKNIIKEEPKIDNKLIFDKLTKK